MEKLEKEIKAIIFDCDGVLVDSEIIASQVVLSMLKPYGFAMDIMEYAKTFAGKVEEDTVNIIKTEYHVPLPDNFLSQLRLQIEDGLDNKLKAISGAQQVIERIKIPKAVVSNSRLVRVIHSLKVAGLENIFEKNLFAAEMVEKPKPDPAVYLYAAQQLKVEPANCLVIEDSVSGATAASKAGMNVIGFLGASHIYDGHASKLKDAGVFTTVSDMKSLGNLLEDVLK